MTFAWPLLLWFLLLPAALLGWELTHRRRAAALTRPKILRAEAGADSLRLTASDAPSSPRGQPRWWLAAGLALAIVALARPQYGRLEEPVFDQSREILLAIDLSRSMLSPDVKPTRLDRAKLLIQSLLEKLQGERVGLVVFSGTSFLQSPLSADYEILREFLPALNPDFLPEGGTNYHALLDASLQAFGNSNAADRFLVILSDGEATDDDWKPLIEDLKKKNIRVIGLGVGTAAGAMIPDGAGGFLKDERGAVVLSKLESGTLQELATATGGAYRDASGWLDLAGLVHDTVEAGRKGKFLEKTTVRLAERFQWPLALGVWCLLVSFYREFPVRPRPRAIRLTSTPPPNPPVMKTTGTAATATAALLLGAWLLPAPARAINPTPTPAASAPSTSAPPPPEPSAALSKIVGRLALSDHRTGRDWAEFSQETINWGSQLQSSQQPIPEGPVRDALAAVETGSALDPKTADWPKLRNQLEDLLKKSEEQKQKQQQQDDKDKQDQKDQDDKNQQDKEQKDQKDQDKKSSDQQQQSKDQKNSQQQKQDQQKQQEQPQSKPEDQQKQGESAFGDMKKNEQPPPPPPPPDPGTQKVGGTPEKKESDQQPPDPSLALPLQKLEQLRNQDSPAHLFQLMEGERKPGTKPKGKDW